MLFKSSVFNDMGQSDVGFLWFKNISHDLETVAIASLYAITGALIVLAISSIMIMKFSPKLFASNETD